MLREFFGAFSLRRLFDTFDEAASSILRLAYLVPFVLATASYFGGDPLAFILAFAVEFQTYSAVRKLATIWNGLKAPALEDFQREKMTKDAWMQVATVFALAGFSVWNQMSYLSENWHPTDSAFGASRELDIVIRAVFPAVFFFLTAFGAPLAKTMGEKVAEQSHKALEAFLGVVKNQRQQAIKQINGEIVDMTDTIQTIAAAANEKRAGSVLASVQGAIVSLARGESAPAPKSSSPASDRPSGHSTKSFEEECRLVWREGMDADELASRVGCAKKTAQRYIKKFQESFVVTERLTAVK